MIKKIIIFASIAALALSLASCGKDGGGSALVDGNGNPVSTAEATAESGAENTENTRAPENGGSENSDAPSGENAGDSAAASENGGGEASEQSSQEQVTPTFMFFYSTSDSNYDKAMQAVTELQESYGDRVKFDLRDIDVDTEAKENFPVEGQTPVLIMLNTSNDISAFEFKVDDKSKMEADIKAALGE